MTQPQDGAAIWMLAALALLLAWIVNRRQ